MGFSRVYFGYQKFVSIDYRGSDNQVCTVSVYLLLVFAAARLLRKYCNQRKLLPHFNFGYFGTAKIKTTLQLCYCTYKDYILASHRHTHVALTSSWNLASLLIWPTELSSFPATYACCNRRITCSGRS